MSMQTKPKTKSKMGPKGPWKWTDERLNKLADELEVWTDNPENTLLSRFCADHGVHPQDLGKYAKSCERLLAAVKKAKAKECHMLEKFCLFGGFTNPLTGKHRKVSTTGAIFLLKNNHHYTDGREAVSASKEDQQILNYITKNYATATSSNGS